MYLTAVRELPAREVREPMSYQDRVATWPRPKSYQMCSCKCELLEQFSQPVRVNMITLALQTHALFVQCECFAHAQLELHLKPAW